jgi:hypothetical protein
MSFKIGLLSFWSLISGFWFKRRHVCCFRMANIRGHSIKFSVVDVCQYDAIQLGARARSGEAQGSS